MSERLLSYGCVDGRWYGADLVQRPPRKYELWRVVDVHTNHSPILDAQRLQCHRQSSDLPTKFCIGPTPILENESLSIVIKSVCRMQGMVERPVRITVDLAQVPVISLVLLDATNLGYVGADTVLCVKPNACCRDSCSSRYESSHDLRRMC